MAVDLHNQLSDNVFVLYELPEACISNVVSKTTPKDACTMETVARWCGVIASSDQVWEKFLPDDYLDILHSSAEGHKLLSASTSKKDLYLRMCDNYLLIENGIKSFALDKRTGKKTYMLSARALAIVWSHTPAYWKFIPLNESRFVSVAELVMVCWLEIQGVINSKVLSPNTKYAAYLVFTVKAAFYGFEHPPGEVSVGFSGQECEKHLVLLNPVGTGASRQRRQVSRWGRRLFYSQPAVPEAADGASSSNANIWKSEQRSDGWLEIELGEIYIRGDEDADVQMMMTETKGGNWKSGLAVEGIEIRPKRD